MAAIRTSTATYSKGEVYMPIIDRRQTKRDKGSTSRQRFIERHKKYLKEKVNDVVNGKSLKDLAKGNNTKIKGNKNDINIGSPHRTSPNDNTVVPGNKDYQKGDTIRVKKNSAGRGPGKGDPGGTTISEDEFQFILTKEEFRSLLFDQLEIPNLYKRSGEGEEVDYLKNAGYTKRGIPGRLSVLKTYIQAIGRHVADQKDKDDEVELDDEDLRYRNLVVKTKPVTKAVMFCVMDVSGSMGETEKTIAKKFYLLMYLFLTTKYNNIDIRFIIYHSEAKEVEEEEFFSTRENGGTYTYYALEKVKEIIDSDYDLNTDNIYLSLVSDGGEFQPELTLTKTKELMTDLNHMAYLEVVDEIWYGYGGPALSEYYKGAEMTKDKNFGLATCKSESAIYDCLRTLFDKGAK